MKKFTLTVLAALLCMMPMMAQISTGEPNSSVIPRTGNRPQAGDFGMYIGGTVTQVIDLVNAIKDDNTNAWGLPVLNLKYYFTDNWEGRIGFEFACKATNDKQVFDGGSSSPDAIAKTSTNHNFTRFLPGCAYHFNTNNLLDVYAGAYIPIGWEVDRTTAKASAGDVKTLLQQSTGKFVIGAGVLLGLQCFIADLPIAIGVETGFSGMIKAGGAPKTISDDGTNKITYYDGNTSLKNHSKSEATWGADAAITFSYYFRK